MSIYLPRLLASSIADSRLSKQLNNRHIKSLKVSLDELRQLVASNEKQRFSLVPVSAGATSATPAADDIHSDDPKDLMIRANQGHSLSIDAEELLTRIDETNLPTTCVHGTTHGAWVLIVASGGLKRMTRQHIHFATGLPEGFKTGSDSTSTSAPVISGMRNSSTVLIYLDIQRALAGGIKFWRSENNVILTEGDETGILPLTYFKLVEDRTGGQGVLAQDGKILKEAPLEWASKGSSRRGGRGGGGRGQ